MPDNGDLQVLISYQKLSELLQAASCIKELQDNQKRIMQRVEALHRDIYDLIDIVGELRKKLR